MPPRPLAFRWSWWPAGSSSPRRTLPVTAWWPRRSCWTSPAAPRTQWQTPQSTLPGSPARSSKAPEARAGRAGQQGPLGAGLVVRFGHGFGLGGALLAQVDRGAHQNRDGEELALPVLEGLEPEPARRQIAQHRHGGLSVRLLVTVVVLRAANRVQDNRRQEQQEEHDRKRVFVELEDPAAVPHRPRRGLFELCLPGVLVLRGGPAHRLGLGGPLLEQEDGEDDVHAHLQEFRLPVLESRLQEVPGAKVLQDGHGRFAVGLLLVAVGACPAQDHAAEKHDEQPDIG